MKILLFYLNCIFFFRLQETTSDHLSPAAHPGIICESAIYEEDFSIITQFQWRSYVTNDFAKQATMDAVECPDKNEFCYINCTTMLPYQKLFMQKRFHSQLCWCHPNNVQSKLPSECYHPSGKSCTWWADCFGSRVNQVCKEPKFANFLHYMCNDIDKKISVLSGIGQKWSAAVKRCLQIRMAPVVTSPNNFTCSDFQEIGYYSHVNCYMHPHNGPSYCSLPLLDRLKLVYVGFQSWVDNPWNTFILTLQVLKESFLRC